MIVHITPGPAPFRQPAWRTEQGDPRATKTQGEAYMRSIKLDITNKAGMRLAVAESAAVPSYRRRGVTIASASLALHRLRLRPAP